MPGETTLQPPSPGGFWPAITSSSTHHNLPFSIFLRWRFSRWLRTWGPALPLAQWPVHHRETESAETTVTGGLSHSKQETLPADSLIVHEVQINRPFGKLRRH